MANAARTSLICHRRLRQMDVKAEHFERQVARIEQERDQWEAKFEEAQGKYLTSKRELEELAQQVRLLHISPSHLLEYLTI